MIDRKAVLHRPMSEYAYGVDEQTLSITIRTGRNNLRTCTLFYGDTACRKPKPDFFSVPMRLVAFDEHFDYYNATFKSKYRRVCYYFKLEAADETKLYYGDLFYDGEVTERSEYYKLPYNRREDIVCPPDWIKDAIVYNIFPDSFASGRRSITGKASRVEYDDGCVSKGLLGGTISGIRQNLDYIKGLGFNAIYLNPIFRAGEYHKYDLIDYYSIDGAFGTDGEFKTLVEECHANGIRVIIDGVFNHCGWNFFAFKDVVANGEKSKYKDWFYELKFPVVVPKSPDDYPEYECFAYERMMPKMNTSNKEVEDYFVAVGKYWIEKFDIDGWRLDVADEVNDAFWRRFYREVKASKKDVVLIGEVWQSAMHWLDGAIFDSAMNYDLRKHCKLYFAENVITSEQFNARVTSMLMRYRKSTVYAQLNLLDSHDVPRFLSLCGEDMHKYKAAVAFQFGFCGAPSVFYGDEQGLCGVNESEYRRAMTFGGGELTDFFRALIALRNKYSCLRGGDYVTEYCENGGLYVFTRRDKNCAVRFVFNMGRGPRDAYEYVNGGKILLANNFQNNVANARSFAIISI